MVSERDRQREGEEKSQIWSQDYKQSYSDNGLDHISSYGPFLLNLFLNREQHENKQDEKFRQIKTEKLKPYLVTLLYMYESILTSMSYTRCRIILD
jgi:hypothetical protein